MTKRYEIPGDYLPNDDDDEVASLLQSGRSPDDIPGCTYLGSAPSKEEAMEVKAAQPDGGPSGARLAMVFDTVEDVWLVFGRTAG